MDEKLKQAMLEIGKIKGKAKRKVSDEDIHSAREKAFERLKNNLKL